MENQSLCKTCSNRFRRLFIPLKPEEYVDENGESTLASEDNIIIINLCLATGIDIDNECTIECNYFEDKVEKKQVRKVNDCLLINKILLID